MSAVAICLRCCWSRGNRGVGSKIPYVTDVLSIPNSFDA
ncbi:hypothetical protein ACPOL_3104 [Acidisarcina polymorpha]|uniref:Uncharacterized protein n=1 Tax=Acidisarcina polymorpha TaxID=2211140 RepID=A0A2Z5G043_9BACT|nr:hypothetical protein ACPOL_3104 [Acidisarcina polymorpha]